MANETQNFERASYRNYVREEIEKARFNAKLGKAAQKEYEELLTLLNSKMEQFINLSEQMKVTDGADKITIAAQIKRLIEEIKELIRRIMEMLKLHARSSRGSLFVNSSAVKTMSDNIEASLGGLIYMADSMEKNYSKEQGLLGDMKQELIAGREEMTSMMTELVAQLKAVKGEIADEQESIKSMWENQPYEAAAKAAAKKAALDEAEPVIKSALKEKELDGPNVHFYRLKCGDYLAVNLFATKLPENRLPGQNTQSPLYAVFDATTGKISNVGYTEQEFVSLLQSGIMDNNEELLQAARNNDVIRKLMDLQEEYTNSRHMVNILESVRSGFFMQDGLDTQTKEEVNALWENIVVTTGREMVLGFTKNSLPLESLRQDTERLSRLISINAKSDTDKKLADMIREMPEHYLAVEEKYLAFAKENREAFAAAMENTVNNMDKAEDRLADFDSVCAEIRQNHETIINRCEEEARAIAKRLSAKEMSVGVLKTDYEQLVDKTLGLHTQALSPDLTVEKANEVMSEMAEVLHETAKIQAQLRIESRKCMPPKEFLENQADRLRKILSNETEVEVNSRLGYINITAHGGDRKLQYYYEGRALSAIKLNDNLLCAFDTKKSEDGLVRDFSYLDKSNAELLNVILEGALQKDRERSGEKFAEAVAKQGGQMKMELSEVDLSGTDSSKTEESPADVQYLVRAEPKMKDDKEVISFKVYEGDKVVKSCVSQEEADAWIQEMSKADANKSGTYADKSGGKLFEKQLDREEER